MPTLSTFGAMSSRGYGLFGKSGFEFEIASSQQELDLETYLTGQGWNGAVSVVLTIPSSIYIRYRHAQ